MRHLRNEYWEAHRMFLYSNYVGEKPRLFHGATELLSGPILGDTQLFYYPPGWDEMIGRAGVAVSTVNINGEDMPVISHFFDTKEFAGKTVWYRTHMIPSCMITCGRVGPPAANQS